MRNIHFLQELYPFHAKFRTLQNPDINRAKNGYFRAIALPTMWSPIQ